MAGSAQTEKNTENDPWMAKLDARVKELHDSQHFCCSQTVLSIGMERLGIENPDLLRAMEGFCGGSCGGMCGALAGGCALLGLYFGKGTASEPRSAVIHDCTDELCETFRAYWKSDRCSDLIHDDPAQRRKVCPALMAGTLEMVWDILREHSVDPDSRQSARKK
jgi:C_GCAxxG_C_C family probable redox protein